MDESKNLHLQRLSNNRSDTGKEELKQFKVISKFYEQNLKMRPVVEDISHRKANLIGLDDYQTTLLVERPNGDKDHTSITQIIYTDNDKTRILILGEPGSGKTTLLDKFISTAYSPQSTVILNTLKYNYVVKLNSHALLDTSWMNKFGKNIEKYPLACFIHHSFPPEVTRSGGNVAETNKLLSESVEKNRFFLILDGLDEIANLLHQEETINGKILQSIINHPEVIITSRPNIITKAFKERFSDGNIVYNEGLDFSMMKQYVQKFFFAPDETDRKNSLINLIQNNQSIQDLCKNPINIIFLCMIWDDEKTQKSFNENGISISGLYDQIVGYLVKRYVDKSGSAEERALFTYANSKSLMNHEMVNKHVAFAYELFNHKPSVDFLQDLSKYGLIRGDYFEGNIEARFTHYTFCEYFVMRKLFADLTNPDAKMRRKALFELEFQKNDKSYFMSLKFLVSHMSQAILSSKGQESEDMRGVFNDFWKIILKPSPGVIELNSNMHVSWLMNMLSQVPDQLLRDESLADTVSILDQLRSNIDDIVLSDLKYWCKDLVVSGYISPYLAEKILFNFADYNRYDVIEIIPFISIKISKFLNGENIDERIVKVVFSLMENNLDDPEFLSIALRMFDFLVRPHWSKDYIQSIGYKLLHMGLPDSVSIDRSAALLYLIKYQIDTAIINLDKTEFTFINGSPDYKEIIVEALASNPARFKKLAPSIKRDFLDINSGMDRLSILRKIVAGNINHSPEVSELYSDLANEFIRNPIFKEERKRSLENREIERFFATLPDQEVRKILASLMNKQGKVEGYLLDFLKLEDYEEKLVPVFFYALLSKIHKREDVSALKKKLIGSCLAQLNSKNKLESEVAQKFFSKFIEKKYLFKFSHVTNILKESVDLHGFWPDPDNMFLILRKMAFNDINSENLARRFFGFISEFCDKGHFDLTDSVTSRKIAEIIFLVKEEFLQEEFLKEQENNLSFLSIVTKAARNDNFGIVDINLSKIDVNLIKEPLSSNWYFYLVFISKLKDMAKAGEKITKFQEILVQAPIDIPFVALSMLDFTNFIRDHEKLLQHNDYLAYVKNKLLPAVMNLPAYRSFKEKHKEALSKLSGDEKIDYNLFLYINDNFNNFVMLDGYPCYVLDEKMKFFLNDRFFSKEDLKIWQLKSSVIKNLVSLDKLSKSQSLELVKLLPDVICELSIHSFPVFIRHMPSFIANMDCHHSMFKALDMLWVYAKNTKDAKAKITSLLSLCFYNDKISHIEFRPGFEDLNFVSELYYITRDATKLINNLIKTDLVTVVDFMSKNISLLVESKFVKVFLQTAVNEMFSRAEEGGDFNYDFLIEMTKFNLLDLGFNFNTEKISSSGKEYKISAKKMEEVYSRLIPHVNQKSKINAFSQTKEDLSLATSEPLSTDHFIISFNLSDDYKFILFERIDVAGYYHYQTVSERGVVSKSHRIIYQDIDTKLRKEIFGDMKYLKNGSYVKPIYKILSFKQKIDNWSEGLSLEKIFNKLGVRSWQDIEKSADLKTFDKNQILALTGKDLEDYQRDEANLVIDQQVKSLQETIASLADKISSHVSENSQVKAMIERDFFKRGFYESIKSKMNGFYLAVAAIDSGFVANDNNKITGIIGNILTKISGAVPIVGSGLAILGDLLVAVDKSVQMTMLSNYNKLASDAVDMAKFSDLIACKLLPDCQLITIPEADSLFKKIKKALKKKKEYSQTEVDLSKEIPQIKLENKSTVSGVNGADYLKGAALGERLAKIIIAKVCSGQMNKIIEDNFDIAKRAELFFEVFDNDFKGGKGEREEQANEIIKDLIKKHGKKWQYKPASEEKVKNKIKQSLDEHPDIAIIDDFNIKLVGFLNNNGFVRHEGGCFKKPCAYINDEADFNQLDSFWLSLSGAD